MVEVAAKETESASRREMTNSTQDTRERRTRLILCTTAELADQPLLSSSDDTRDRELLTGVPSEAVVACWL